MHNRWLERIFLLRVSKQAGRQCDITCNCRMLLTHSVYLLSLLELPNLNSRMLKTICISIELTHAVQSHLQGVTDSSFVSPLSSLQLPNPNSRMLKTHNFYFHWAHYSYLLWSAGCYRLTIVSVLTSFMLPNLKCRMLQTHNLCLCWAHSSCLISTVVT